MQQLEKYLMQLVMVKGLSGAQFGLLSYNWLTKSDDREVEVWFITQEHAHDANCATTQAWCIHCLISAQIRLVITNCVQEFFYYSFDHGCNLTHK